MTPNPPPTQSVALWQVTDSSLSLVWCQAARPPPGSVDVAISPLSVLTHSTGEAGTQENDPAPVLPVEFLVTFQARTPPAGLDDVRTDPASSRATHSDAVAQDTPETSNPNSKGGCSTRVGADQVKAGLPAARAADGSIAAPTNPSTAARQVSNRTGIQILLRVSAQADHRSIIETRQRGTRMTGSPFRFQLAQLRAV